MTKTKLTSELTFAEIKAIEELVYFGRLFTDIEFTQWLWACLEGRTDEVEIKIMDNTTAIISDDVKYFDDLGKEKGYWT